MLYVFAHWHGFAKLRRHISMTVEVLRHATTRLGHELREFSRYTSDLEIYETTKEHTAREQRIRKKSRPRAALAVEPDPPEPLHDPLPQARRRKYFNLETVKFHALADYPDSIQQFGTTDSTSTQTGELLNRHDKRRYDRTNGKKYVQQMEKIQRIETRLSNIKQDLLGLKPSNPMLTKSNSTIISIIAPEELPLHDAGRSPYQIALSQKNQILLLTWLDTHRPDPAVKDFLPRLKTHLLTRLEGGSYKEAAPPSTSQLTKIQFQYDRIYAHQTLKARYTTYDVRRNEDKINPSTPKHFVLALSSTSTTPSSGADRFWYAQVLGIYHANVSYDGSRSKRVDFLWVRWLARTGDVPGGWDTCRLDQVGYFLDSKPHHAFEFIDPADVVRAAHLIPRFCSGQTADYLESMDSLAADTEFNKDWKRYYVGRFVDHDMLMRFTGMAIGHLTHRDIFGSHVGLSAELPDTVYEYSADQVAEGGNSSWTTDDTIDGEDETGDKDSNEDESDECTSDIEQVDAMGDDERIEDMDDDVSW
ncbi:unnamed protein product [Rhizoctonia solani]|uniref:Uncharacterized protein n=1 Tax=Rhizoctonia solani TaxID=456999 RepID=A0A8H3B540_9AGAM|nr:unnamed protein product [Rhizoctonia solani]